MCGKLKYLAEKGICRQRCYDGLYELNNRYAITNKVRGQLWRACQGERGSLALIFMALSSHPTIIWETTLGSPVTVFWATFGVCGSSPTICSVCHITRGQYWKAPLKQYDTCKRFQEAAEAMVVLSSLTKPSSFQPLYLEVLLLEAIVEFSYPSA